MVKSISFVQLSKFTKYVLIIGLFQLIPFNLFAQYISNGQDPALVKWRQINTEKFQVIYPANYENQAQLLTSWLMEAYVKVDSSMASNPRKISVIMHSKTAYSNGMVLWAPRRVELYNSPNQDIDGLDWVKGLAIHEYRHVVQIEKMNQGFTRILSWLLGEQATVVPLGLYVPIWFLEGDAVVTETAFSKGGRGRQPEFLQGFKALTVEQGLQKYDKALLGSYKDFIPNHYESGYYTVAVNRLLKNDSVFQTKLNNAAKNWINPFGGNSGGLRDGKRTEKYYGYAFDYLNNEWKKQELEKEFTSYESLLNAKKDYEDYSRLQKAGDRLLAWHQSYGKVPEIVEIKPDGSIQRILKVGGFADRTFSTTNNCILWSELRYDKRWEQRAWSDIYSYNIESGVKKRLTRHQRLFAPVLSPDKTAAIFAAVEADDQNKYSVKIFDVATGEMLRKIPNPTNGYILHPCFTADGKSLVYVRLQNNGKGLFMYSLNNDEEIELLPPSFVEIGYPSCTAQGVYFTGAWTGENNIYFYNWKTKATNQVTNARFGANFSVAINDSTLAFANYSSTGYKPVILAKNNFKNTALSTIHFKGFPLVNGMDSIETGSIEFSDSLNSTFPSEKYSKAAHLFHFHSWTLPFGFDLDNVQLYPGFSLLSQNMLSTSFLTLGADFSPDKVLERYFAKYSFEGWYPKLDFYIKEGADRIKLESGPYSRMQIMLGAKATVPFSFYRGLYATGINPAFSVQYAVLRYQLDDPTNLDAIQSRTFEQWNVEPSLYVYRLRQRSKRDLYARWGQVLRLGYSSDLSAEFNIGAIAYGSLQLYFPGLLKHHSLIIGNSYQYKFHGDYDSDLQNYYYQNDRIKFPRGETAVFNNRLYSFTADYRFPVAYPDWSLGKFVYIRRINMGLFYDYSQVWTMPESDYFSESYYNNNGNHDYNSVISTGINLNNWSVYNSTGGSVYFDVNPLRYEFNMRIGIQAGVNLRTQKYFNTLILSFNL